MVSVENNAIHIRHLTIESHSGLQTCDVFHTPHIFALRNEHRRSLFAHRSNLNRKLCAAQLRETGLESLRKVIAFCLRQTALSCFCLGNQAICGVTVYTDEARLLKFLLQHLHERRIELAIEQQDAVALRLGRLYVSILFLFAVGIKVNEVTIFVCLLSSDELLILFKGIIFPADVFQQGISLGTIKEILLAEHTIVDKEFQVVPFLLESLAIFLEDAL